MRAYYGNRFSANMTKTPEGYLICHNVPIARIGWQDYLPQDLPQDMGAPDAGIVKVYRPPEEVFAPATIASFEGKPVTDNHPPIDVDACNYAAYTKGTASNIRCDAQNEYLLADLIIHDATLIAEIYAGKREISCGYDCVYAVAEDGTYQQTNIIGNHIAVVQRGRAGRQVAIKDEKPKEIDKMGKGNIIARMFKKFCTDAEPEEVKEAIDAIGEMNSAEGKTNDEGTELKQEIENLKSMITALESKISTKDNEEEKTALDELESELAKDTDEESATVPAEEIKDEECEKEKTTDNESTLRVLRAIKPIIAGLPDEQRKKVSDEMGKAMRGALAVKPQQKADYAKLLKRKTQDAAAPNNNRMAFGEACKKRNPHIKKEGN